MADISLKIKSDFEQAEKDFQSLKNSSESVRKQVEKFQQSFKSEQIDKFTERNKLAATAATATGGKIAGMQKEYSGLQREIQRLISKGMSPQDIEIQKLIKDYNKLDKELASTSKATDQTAVSFGSLVKGIVGANIIQSALYKIKDGFSAIVTEAMKLEDAEAAFTPLMGEATKAKKLVKALNVAAAETPYQFETIQKSVSTLLPVMNGNIEKTVETFKMLGDTAGGNIQKLDSVTRGYTKAMLKGKVDMESLNMIAEAGVPIFQEMAETMGYGKDNMEAFFKKISTGKVSTDELTKAFQKMTSEGGKFYQGMITASKTTSGIISTLKDNIAMTAAGIGQAFLPYIKEAALVLIKVSAGVLKWVQTGDNLKNTLTALGYIFSAIAGGIVAFKVASIAASVASGGFSIAIKALTGAMAANPIGLIAVVITAVLIPAIIYLVKNFDKVKFYVIDFALAARQKMLELTLLIQEKVTGAVMEMLEKFRELPIVGKMFGKLIDYQKGYTQQIRNDISAIEESRQTRRAAFEELMAQKQKEIDAAKAESDSVLNNNNLINESELNKAATFEEALKTMSDKRLEDYEAQLEASQTFFDQKAEMEALDYERRMEAQNEFIENQKNAENAFVDGQAEMRKKTNKKRETDEYTHMQNRLKMLKKYLNEVTVNESLTGEQRKVIEAGIWEQITKEEQKLSTARTTFANSLLTQAGDLATSLQTIYENSGKKSRELAIAMKAISMAQAAINTALAISNTLATYPPPYSFILAAVTAAAGIAQQIAIATTPIPSAQTGLMDYTVPDTRANTLDRAAVMASPGEKVSITPRSEESSRDLSVNININEDNIFSLVQKGIDSGRINVNDNNIGRAVFA
jgi:tape measure domain-containing protein